MHFSHRFPLLALLALLLGVTACDYVDPIPRPPSLLDEAEENVGAWTWIDVPGATCRDGSATGLGVRLQEDAEGAITDDVVIYMEGGGACFNQPTCSRNPASFGEADFFSDDFIGGFGEAGLFNTGRAENPVGSWNMVYVPYCTGDVHSGSNPGAMVPGVEGEQQFVGYENFALYVQALEDYFETGLDDVLVTGASAGGFGTLANYEQVAQAFPQANATLLDDSGPILPADSVLTPGLQGLWISLWNLQATYPGDPIAAPEDLEDIYGYYAETYPNASFGLASHEEDRTIRFFYSFGIAAQDPSCAQDLARNDVCISGPAYEAALYALRDDLPGPWKTFYADGNPHTFLRSEDRYYTTEAGGVPLSAWIGDLIRGEAEDEGTPENH